MLKRPHFLFVLCSLTLTAAAGVARAGDITVDSQWGRDGRMHFQAGSTRLTFVKGEPAIRWNATLDKAPLAEIRLAPHIAGQREAPTLDAIKIDSHEPDRLDSELVWRGGSGVFRLTLTLHRDGRIVLSTRSDDAGLAVLAPLRYAVLPNRHLDDVVYNPVLYNAAEAYLPSDHLAVGLIEGRREMVSIGWAGGLRPVKLLAENPATPEGRFTRMEIALSEQPLALERHSATVALWTVKDLKNEHKDTRTELGFAPPFDAAWIAQILEDGVPTTYPFQTLKGNPGRMFRPGLANITYPLHIENGQATLRYPGRYQLQDELIVYALEGHRNTPYGMLARQFGREGLSEVPEAGGAEQTGTLFRSGIPSVLQAACVGRDQVRESHFKTGSQDRVADFIATYSVDRQGTATISELQHRRYEDWIALLRSDMEAWREEAAAKPGARTFLAAMTERLDDIESTCHARLRLSAAERLDNVNRLQERMAELAHENGEEVYPEIRYVLDELNDSLSVQEVLGRRFGTAARGMAQAAALESAAVPDALPYAQKIRRHVLDVLTIRRWETPWTWRPSSLPDYKD